jgi:glycosyltransferase involved in cell wall biosynthesis
MHVGVNARPFSISHPGGEVQAGIAVVRALSDRPDLEVTLFGHESLTGEFPGVRVVSKGFPFDSQVFGIAWESTYLPRLAHDVGVDVLFCPTSNGPVRQTTVPVVTSIHDIFAYRGDAGGLYGRLQRFRLPRVVEHSDAITTVSEFSRDELLGEFPDLDPETIRVVYNGVDELFLDDRRGEPLSVPDPFVLFVGGLNKRKNFEGLLEAFVRARTEYGLPHELVIAGPDAKRIYGRVEERLSREVVHHVGFVADRQLVWLYRNADAFAFPSLAEGFGLPPLEAMACETPVISSDRPCMPEVLGDAARFVDPTDPDAFAGALYEVLTDEQLRSELRERGRKRASNFTWDRTTELTVDVIERVAWRH